MAIIVDKYELIFYVPNLVKVSEKIYLKVLEEVRTEIGKNLRPLYRHMLQRWASVCGLRLSWNCKKNPELQIQVLDMCGNEVKVRICFPLIDGSSYLQYVVLQKIANKYELEGKVGLSPALGMETSIFLSEEFTPMEVRPPESPSNGHGQKYFIATSETGKSWNELNIR